MGLAQRNQNQSEQTVKARHARRDQPEPRFLHHSRIRALEVLVSERGDGTAGRAQAQRQISTHYPGRVCGLDEGEAADFRRHSHLGRQDLRSGFGWAHLRLRQAAKTPQMDEYQSAARVQLFSPGRPPVLLLLRWNHPYLCDGNAAALTEFE